MSNIALTAARIDSARNVTAEERIINSAVRQLDLVMGFFPRIDAKVTAILGIEIAMLGFLAANTPQLSLWSYWMAVAVAPVALTAVSMRYLYVCSFPHLEGGRSSLIYFREVASRPEDEYTVQFIAQRDDARARDVLSQVWRNSQILEKKFDALKRAHLWLIAALPPWIASLCVFVAISRNQGGLFH
jgi:hypothetical protein